MPGRPPLTVRLLAAALLLLATGCTSSGDDPAPGATGPVDVTAPTVGDDVRRSCAALVAALPVEVDPGVRRRPVVGDDSLTAAWGDPPVTLACGVPDPDRPDEPVTVTVNGVGWSVRDIGAGYRWTTRDLAVNVAVDIPASYENGAEIVNPLCAPILAALEPSTG